MTKVTITFNVPDEEYNTYEDILDDFMNDIIDIGVQNLILQKNKGVKNHGRLKISRTFYCTGNRK